MTDPLTDHLTERVRAATPPALTGFDDVRRRAARHRLQVVAAVAATVALVVGAGLAGWAARGDAQDRAVGPAATPTTSYPIVPEASDPTPSGLVALLPDGELPLPANDRCWDSEPCLRAQMWQQTGPDLGSPDVVDVRFERAGWDFTATFTPLGESCPRSTTVVAEPTGGRTFRVQPAGPAGTYQVELSGYGDDGLVSSRFVWTTTSDGPVEPPLGRIQVVPQSRSGPSHAMEVLFTDLPFQPTRSEVSRQATVAVEAADGTRTEVTVPLETESLECLQRGTVYYQREWLTSIDPLGPAPWTLTVTVTIRGTEYTGSGTWAGPAEDPNVQGYGPLTWDPALPE